MKKNDMNPLIIDCQIFQTFSWNRGMGKYSMELVDALCSTPDFKNRKITFLFSKQAKRNVEAEERLQQICPTAQLLFLDLGLPKEPRDRNNIQDVRLANKEVLKKHLGTDQKLLPDFLILSLYLDEVCPVFPDEGYVNQRLLLYYDSIPFLYHERYGSMPGFFDNFYLPHTASLFEADKIFTISKTVANDLHLSFGTFKSRIFNIDGAPIPRGAKKAKKPANFAHRPDEFVLMPTGQELRKNNERAVRGFEKFLTETGTDRTLVVTSNFSDEGRKHLNEICKNVIFTGNVSEAELLWLYQNCRYVLFPPEYEGLGLPVLEAVEQEKRVACSDISVFREMSEEAFVMFDPLDVDSIAVGIAEADRTYQAIDTSMYKKLLDTYAWTETASKFINGYVSPAVVSPVKHKKRIAIFAPDVSGFSAIGKDIGELHDVYSQFFDIDYYFDKGPNHRVLRPNFLKYVANCYRAKDFKKGDQAKYDALIYHMGNSEYHLHIARIALRYPGYMVLHDTDLGGLYNNLAELGFITDYRIKAEEKLEDALNTTRKKNLDKSNLITSMINSQRAVVVHSAYAQQAVKAKLLHENPVAYLELPFSTPIFPDILRKKTHTLTIAFAGIIAPIKGLDIMQQIASKEEFADYKINVFGFSVGDPAQLRDLRDFPNVNVVTNPSDFDFQRLLAESDIMINVRLAYRGETSGSTLSHMRYGGIAIVRDFGWFSELPDTAVVKVGKPEETTAALKRLVEATVEERAKMSAAALEFMNSYHMHDAYTEGMYKLIDRHNS